MIGVLDDVLYEVEDTEYSIPSSELHIGATELESESSGKDDHETFITRVSATTPHGAFEWLVTTEQLFGPPTITDVVHIRMPTDVEILDNLRPRVVTG